MKNDFSETVWVFGSKGLEAMMSPGESKKFDTPFGTWIFVFPSKLTAVAALHLNNSCTHELKWWYDTRDRHPHMDIPGGSIGKGDPFVFNVVRKLAGF